MAYFAIYDQESGEIENVVECPEFLESTIHLEDHQQHLQVEFQVSAQQYVIIDRLLVLRK